MKTPVAFFIFNRPDTTQQVFSAIRQAKPSKLLAIADGPRPQVPSDFDNCQATRDLLKQVDWDCQVLTLYSNLNLGCKQRVSSGLDWVFSKVEEAIILEDDCLPHPSFFLFCEELLDKYRDDKRIWKIDGTNILQKWKSAFQSYHFSNFGAIWGWASWRRAWQNYDVEMKLWANPEAQNRIRDVIGDRQQYLNRKKVFARTYAGTIDTWDYQWGFARLLNSGLSVVPSVNLVSNIGFTHSATRTKVDISGVANLPCFPMTFPLKEPCGIAVDRDYDKLRYQKTWQQTLQKKILRKLTTLRSQYPLKRSSIP
ncbi:MAG: glycosyltransferase family 2 protein [Cyanobacteriota bacterium]|nr:glycosyltransferase family 2 protein [Cyanobacteriota bacterium]